MACFRMNRVAGGRASVPRSAARMRAQLRMPLWNEVRSYFSFGEWMRSSSRPKPISSVSMPSRRLKSPTIGIEAPEPISTASLPHSSVSARRAAPSAGMPQSSAIAGAPVWLMNSAVQSAGSRARTKARKAVADPVRVLIADQAERHLGRRFGRDHRLRALAGVAADDAVHVAGRPRRDLLDQQAVLLAGRHLQPDLAEEALRRRVRAPSHCRRMSAGSSRTPS